MVGGLVTSTLFTLLVLPAVYLALEQAGIQARTRFDRLLGRATGYVAPR